MNRASREFVADKLLQEKILDLHPVPTNFKEPPVLDEVTLNTLNAMKKTFTIQKDNTLKRAQNKIRDALGPFSRLLKHFADIDSNRTTMNLEQTRVLFEQTAMLLGQAQVSLNHTRRKAILANLTDEKSAKELLKVNCHIFLPPNFFG